MHPVFEKNHAIQQSYSESYQDGPGDLIYDGKIMNCQLFAQITGHHNLPHICSHIDEQTNRKNDNSFL